LSNDDGVGSQGLELLRKALLSHCDVVVCAPESEQSASSHSLSLHRPLRLWEKEPGVWSVDGTPADCVYVALNAAGRILARKPQLVVSGINHGLNLGDDVFYSGTVAAAREGALKGIPAIAFSAVYQADLEAAALGAANLVASLLTAPPTRPVLLNVNFPRGKSWSYRATRLGARVYKDGVDFRRDPRGREYLWIGIGGQITHRAVAGSDTEAFDQGVVGITPLVLDLWGRADQPEAEALAAWMGKNGSSP
jgi:5'-nucleotidase